MHTRQTTDVSAYADGLILYVIATKTFPSPDGPKSGTFTATMEKLPYLEELGITGIWLSGHQNWFSGGSWCMADFDRLGGHAV